MTAEGIPASLMMAVQARHHRLALAGSAQAHGEVQLSQHIDALSVVSSPTLQGC